jgi:HlyD family secretion protein
MSGASEQTQSTNLFRAEALAHVAIPERVDMLMQVTRPRSWLPLLCLTLVLFLGVLWSIFGRIPINVSGRGILIRPGKVLGFQAPAPGQLQSLNVHVGDVVQKGSVLAVLDQASLRKQLEQERAKLEAMKAEYGAVAELQKERAALEKSILTERRQDLAKRIEETRTIADRLRETHLKSIDDQRSNIQRGLELAKRITGLKKQLLERTERLRNQNAGSKEEIAEAEYQYLQVLTHEIDLQGQLQQLDLRTQQTQDSYLDKMDKISQLTSQSGEYAMLERKLEQQTLELSVTHRLAIRAVEQQAAHLALLVEREGRIVSEYNGRVLEITAAVGQVLAAGNKIGTLVEEDESAPMVCLAFFNVKNGKQAAAGMRTQIAPDPIQRERYGSMTGTVRSVTPFAVSNEAAVNSIGNTEMAKSLTSQERQMEVIIDLRVDPATTSGYAWTSSRGPEAEMTPGTTATVQITVERRAPISFVLPFLHEWTGN